MQLASTQEYANFRAWVPRNVVSVGVQNTQSWLYYDWGPRTYPEPIVCFHSLIGSPESFFNQIISLAPRGYRVLSVQIPTYWTVSDYCDALHAFLDMLSLSRIHVYAAGLGAFLAMQYAVRRPDRIASVMLTHAFLSTEGVAGPIPYSPGVLRWLPDFLVRSTMRALLPKGRTTPSQAYAAEFAIGHTMSLPREILAARLSLLVTKSSVVSRLHIAESRITLIDTLDRSSSSLTLSERTAKSLSNARRAFLKTGGDYPYLSVPEEVNVHLVVHLRRHAVKPKSPVPLPPPARRRPPPPAPPTYTQQSSKNQESVSENVSESSAAKSSPKERKRRPPEEIIAGAKAVVSADERAAVERYAFEINRLREFLPSREDVFLASVLIDCDGSLDEAIERAQADEFDSSFYHKKRARAIDEAISSLQRIDEEEIDDGISTTLSVDPLGGAEQSIDALESHSPKSDNNTDEIEGRGNAVDPIPTDDEMSGDGQRLRSTDPHTLRGGHHASMSELFISSDRTGMRPVTPLVGRGPAPFRSMGPGDESWMLAPPQAEDDDREAKSVTDGAIHPSGSSLLDEGNDPLAPRSSSSNIDEKRDTLFSWKGVLPQDGGHPHGLHNASQSADRSGEGDGWSRFRRRDMGDSTNLDDSSVNVSDSTDQNSADNDDVNQEPAEETEEQRRLRLWSMSALAAASKSVHR